MRISTVLKSLVALVVVAVTGVAVVLSTLDVNKYKDVVAAQVEAMTGRRLTLDGNLDLALGFSPAIVVNQASFANASWGSRPHMVSVERVEAELALIPALFGDIRVGRLVLVRPDILLETNAKGVGNWEFPVGKPEGQKKPAASAPSGSPAPDAAPSAGAPIPFLASVLIKDGRLTWRDGKTGTTKVLELAGVSLGASSPHDPVSLDIRGSFDAVGFDVAGGLGPVAALLNKGSDGKPWPLSVKGDVGGIDFTADGAIKDPLSGAGLALKLHVRASSLEKLKPLIGDVPKIPAVDLAVSVSGGGTAWKVSDLVLSSGSSKVTGTVGIETGGARPRVDVALQSPLLDLKALLPSSQSAGKAAPTAGTGSVSAGGAAGSHSGKVFSAERLDLSGLKAVDARFDIQVSRLVMPDAVELEAVAAKGELVNGRLGITPASMRLGDGTVTANIHLAAPAGPADFKLDAKADKVVLGRVFSQIGKTDLLSGVPSDATVSLKANGSSVAALMASLDGRILVRMGEGRINNALIDWAGADILNQLAEQLNPVGKREPNTHLMCGVMNVQANHGVLGWDKQIAFETAKMNVVSSGKVDLGREALDVGVRPSAKGGVGVGVGALADFLRLQGTLASPSIGVDAAGVAKTALSIAGALAGGGGGKSLLGALQGGNAAGSSSADPSPCATALGQGGKSSSSDGAQPSKQAPAAPDNPVDSIKKGLKGLLR
ncbi:AsmA family protein [Haematospirillum jordaniae]|uniref:AsmA domain-containing protein n=1 Tax=Haematospirillum jordaniae TaxID=1549855 RepID=A0A143DCG1_9PROT|nr:AsmA family protein [Haematospirillum jordaniae]AMW33953.1 hypothetical protein AY555_00810 [Haematospirillum jordaniae]NKD44400.1 AsmA family protein [Haematospirillum jordaniae]NKD57420.1 AsmA family protein [Haematospirillum jordaniae]NKD59882.1 AsmA family protein [Haematospirillum jordaniae]NKD67749.1 AsmA family protein [Haematospirillum jordaniae]